MRNISGIVGYRMGSCGVDSGKGGGCLLGRRKGIEILMRNG